MKDNAGWMWYRGQRPVVLFPEGTKTNGLGILNIDEGVINMIAEAANIDNNMRLHAIRFDHFFSYYSSYNSTDSWGFWSFIGIIS